MRKLGFIGDNNQPTGYYDLLRDPNERPFVLADRLRDLYSDLFSVNTQIHRASDQDIKGAIARVTGKDETTIDRNFRTFKALAQIANFDHRPGGSVAPGQTSGTKTFNSASSVDREPVEQREHLKAGRSSFQYKIQIIIPTTTEVAVYNAIFKSLRDNLDL